MFNVKPLPPNLFYQPLFNGGYDLSFSVVDEKGVVTPLIKPDPKAEKALNIHISSIAKDPFSCEISGNFFPGTYKASITKQEIDYLASGQPFTIETLKNLMPRIFYQIVTKCDNWELRKALKLPEPRDGLILFRETSPVERRKRRQQRTAWQNISSSRSFETEIPSQFATPEFQIFNEFDCLDANRIGLTHYIAGAGPNYKFQAENFFDALLSMPQPPSTIVQLGKAHKSYGMDFFDYVDSPEMDGSKLVQEMLPFNKAITKTKKDGRNPHNIMVHSLPVADGSAIPLADWENRDREYSHLAGLYKIYRNTEKDVFIHCAAGVGRTIHLILIFLLLDYYQDVFEKSTTAAETAAKIENVLKFIEKYRSITVSQEQLIQAVNIAYQLRSYELALKPELRKNRTNIISFEDLVVDSKTPSQAKMPCWLNNSGELSFINMGRALLSTIYRGLRCLVKDYPLRTLFFCSFIALSLLFAPVIVTGYEISQVMAGTACVVDLLFILPFFLAFGWKPLANSRLVVAFKNLGDYLERPFRDPFYEANKPLLSEKTYDVTVTTLRAVKLFLIVGAVMAMAYFIAPLITVALSGIAVLAVKTLLTMAMGFFMNLLIAVSWHLYHKPVAPVLVTYTEKDIEIPPRPAVAESCGPTGYTSPAAVGPGASAVAASLPMFRTAAPEAISAAASGSSVVRGLGCEPGFR